MEYTEVIQLAQDVAKELGNGWAFKPYDEPYPTQRITGPNEAEISIRIETYGSRKGKVEVHGNFHIGRNNEFIDVRGSTYNTLPSISVTGSRGVTAIVKAIKSRFLPEYLPLLAKAVAKRDAYIAHEDTSRENLIALATIVNARVPSERDRTTASFYTHDRSGEITVSCHSVTLKLNSLTIDQAKRILEIL
jgi:hypothetical protein